MDRSEIDSLKADLRRMQARVDELETAGEEPVNRRNMLRGLGAAAAGAAVGGLAFARPAAAVDGATLIIGDATQTAQSPTAIIPASSWSSSPLFGAFTVTNDGAFSDTQAALSMITAYADDTKTGGFTTGLLAASKAGTGAKMDAPVPLKLLDSSASGPPSTSSGRTGQFKVDDGDLWFCTYDDGLFGGSNPKWRKITGQNVAGAFHAVTPFRAYDSRAAAPTPGVISIGQNRLVSVKDERDNSGVVITANKVPANARAVSANITITGTVGGFGYLAINPGGDTVERASTINWAASNQTIANGVMLTLNTTREITVICNGAAGNSTHFIVDVSGYFL
ncbi:MAG: hypothetical protein HY826_15445 [Actinobacteria bacterium]|nr:hypothetical protein [Actinomycetota bacterium]